MSNIFIREIKIKSLRNINNITISNSEAIKKHFFITGKNGTGKTTLLISICNYLVNGMKNDHSSLKGDLDKYLKLKEKKDNIIKMSKEDSSIGYGQAIHSLDQQIDGCIPYGYNNEELYLNIEGLDSLKKKYQSGEFIIAFFNARRTTEVKIPNSISKLALKRVYSIDERISKEIVQYMVNLTADRLFAKEVNDTQTDIYIDMWFVRFKNFLKIMLSNEDFKLEFDRNNYNYYIKEKGKERYDFSQLSDGYSAVFSMVTELMLRMEGYDKSYNLPGIVVIDEPELHLHVELQKQIMPMLINMFPKIQFIIATHSPFIINSIQDTIIIDLEEHKIYKDFSKYSYDAIVENYLKTDLYSNILKEKYEEYKFISQKKELNTNDINLLKDLENYFLNLDIKGNEEISSAIKLLKLKR
jgi:predicted ATPase